MTPEHSIHLVPEQDKVLPDQEVLLHHLVKKVAQSPSVKVLQGTEDMVNEVVLESDVDGTHYYLVRCKPKSRYGVHLSPRELAIARLIAQGLPNKCISNSLEISPWTVSTHLRRIFIKLGVTSRAAMVARLMEANLLQD